MPILVNYFSIYIFHLSIEAKALNKLLVGLLNS